MSYPSFTQGFLQQVTLAFGDMYGSSSNNKIGYIYRETTGAPRYTISINQSEALEFEADKNEDTRVDRTSLGAKFTTGQVSANISRRAKGTADSWDTVQSWFDYLSESYTCDFSTYDYKWDLNDGT